MKRTNSRKLNIKSWSASDRPREKMILKGKESLSDAELIAILLGSGSKDLTAVGLAQTVLNDVEYNLHELGKKDSSDLCQYHGIGPAKAIAIMAAMELGRRRQLSGPKIPPSITSSQDAYNLLWPVLADLPREEFYVLLLNQGGRLIRRKRISSGGVSAVMVDSRLIFKEAIQHLASSIILAHNHPSGTLKPSIHDRQLTEKLVKGSTYLDLKVHDHLIITQGGYFSFADEGLM